MNWGSRLTEQYRSTPAIRSANVTIPDLRRIASFFIAAIFSSLRGYAFQKTSPKSDGQSSGTVDASRARIPELSFFLSFLRVSSEEEREVREVREVREEREVREVSISAFFVSADSVEFRGIRFLSRSFRSCLSYEVSVEFRGISMEFRRISICSIPCCITRSISFPWNSVEIPLLFRKVTMSAIALKLPPPPS